MAKLRYIVRVSHKTKGIGYSVKDALQNAQRQDTSPIEQAKIIGIPSSTSTEISVTIDDIVATSVIDQAIKKSGRLPSNGNLHPDYTIELEAEEEVKIEHYDNKKIDEKPTRKSSVERHTPIRSPLEGMLAYFDTTRYSPQQVFDNTEDKDYAKIVFEGKLENSFLNYFNHITGDSITQKEMNKIIREQLLDDEELIELKSKYDIAKREAEFLVGLRKDPNAPKTLRDEIDDLIKKVIDKGTIEIIRDYFVTIKEQDKLRTLKDKLSVAKIGYDTFNEHLQLLTEAGNEIPVLFSYSGDSLEIYVPFNQKNANDDLTNSLLDEFQSRFSSSSIEPIEGKFLGYHVIGASDYSKGIETTINNVPTTLRLAGVKGIIPYVLGKQEK